MAKTSKEGSALRLQKSGPELHQTPGWTLPEVFFWSVRIGRAGQEEGGSHEVGLTRAERSQGAGLRDRGSGFLGMRSES